MTEHYGIRGEGGVGDPVAARNRRQGDGTLAPLAEGEFEWATDTPEDRDRWVLGADLVSVEVKDEALTAFEDKCQELDERWAQALRDGIPVTVNGVDAVLRYTERDERRWQLWVPGLTAPAGGLLVALQEPLNDKLMLRVQGVPKLTAGKQGILDHVNVADAAWEDGKAAVKLMYDGGATAAQINAYDVEQLAWPPNTW